MAKTKKPPKWLDVYPQGTKEGNEEQSFFIALGRHPKYQWRSTAAIAKESGLEVDRVEEIIAKYYKKGMVFQNPKNEDQWGYWERCPEMLKDDSKSVVQMDHKKRINDALTPSASILVDFPPAPTVTCDIQIQDFIAADAACEVEFEIPPPIIPALDIEIMAEIPDITIELPEFVCYTGVVSIDVPDVPFPDVVMEVKPGTGKIRNPFADIDPNLIIQGPDDVDRAIAYVQQKHEKEDCWVLDV